MSEQPGQSIAKPLGRVVSGVYILSAQHEGAASAMMASWVMQASFEPPLLTIALAKDRPIGQMIRQSRKLALSIVSAEDKTLMRFYARLKGGDDPFLGVQTRVSPGGIPILTDALGYLDCTLQAVHEIGGDHELYIAQVTAGEMLREGTAFAHQRGSGLHY